jgi:basic amino acid/polyamine antiporter, APA family
LWPNRDLKMEGGDMPAADEKPAVFVRKASGLIRTAGMRDVIGYNANAANVGLLLLFVFLYMGWYSGANWIWATILSMLVILPLSLVYGYLSSAMPRSGGDYVWVSRVLGPPFGMMSNLNSSIWYIFYTGVPAAFLGRYGLAPFFRTMGIYTGNTALIDVGNWFATKTGTFILGAILIIVVVGILSIGTKTYFKVQNILILFATASTIVTILVFLGKDHTSVMHAVSSHLASVSGQSDAASVITQSAKDFSGFAGHGAFSVYTTLLAMTVIYFNLSFMQASSFIGSEVKDARHIQLWAMPLTLALVGGGALVSIWAIVHASGYDFLSAIALADPSKLGLSSSLTFTELAAYVANNVVLAFIITFGFIFWTYVWMPNETLNVSRCLMAYSIDGIFPAWFKRVNARTTTPVNAMTFVGVVAMIALALYVYTGWLATLVGIFGFILSFLLVSLAAILLPFRLKNVFETSSINQRIAGVPVISIIGLLSLIAQGFMAWDFLADPNAGLRGHPRMLILNLVIFVSGFVVYYIAKFIRGRQGQDISLSFRELPEE